MSTHLSAPFVWFGGKSRAAPIIWQHLGTPNNYIEPFFGSGAILLGAPVIARYETVNDKDGFVCNAWRAITYAPAKVAHYATWPLNENDLHARHAWLLRKRKHLTARLSGDPTFYNAKIAGWWLWGIACWIGNGWCNGVGAWYVKKGKLVKRTTAKQEVSRDGVHMQGHSMVQAYRSGVACYKNEEDLYRYMHALAERLQHVRVCCGNWSRVLGTTPSKNLGLTAIVLDPPYSADRTANVYAVDDMHVAKAVRKWAIKHGDDPQLRIVLCGYDQEHAMPTAWKRVGWVASGGYSRSKTTENMNKFKETLWFSPHCVFHQTMTPLFY